MSLDEKIKACKRITGDCSEEEKINRTIEKSKEAYWAGEAERDVSWLEFLYQQTVYIRKRWWLAQAAVLAALWLALFLSQSSIYEQRCMGILAPAFAILLLPELWRNRNYASMEVESAAYFSLRKIYAARMMLFGMVDVCLLSIFFAACVMTTPISVKDLLIQFILPLNITCCICFRTLGSKRHMNTYSSLAFCLVWISVWALIVLKNSIYEMISTPVWAGVVFFSVIYLCYSVSHAVKYCEEYYENNAALG